MRGQGIHTLVAMLKWSVGVTSIIGCQKKSFYHQGILSKWVCACILVAKLGAASLPSWYFIWLLSWDSPKLTTPRALNLASPKNWLRCGPFLELTPQCAHADCKVSSDRGVENMTYRFKREGNVLQSSSCLKQYYTLRNVGIHDSIWLNMSFF